MAKVEKYRKLPDGLSSLLNKILRAVLISRPLEALRFLADYLEAELNRRTLCDIQIRQTCPSEVSHHPTDPWVQYMSFVTIQRAIEDVLREEEGSNSFQSNHQPPHHLKVALRKCEGSSTRRRVSHKPFPWPPVVKATPHCRLRCDRYGPIVKTFSITNRAIRRYVRADDQGPEVVDRCQGRRPITNYWRQILRDCSVKASEWNRKSEEQRPRRRRRSSPLTTDMTSSGLDDEGGSGEGSASSVDRYLEPKRRRKARNDEGLAKIIYRELLGLPVEVWRPSDVVEKLPPGMASKAVQVEIIPSRLPKRSPSPTPSATCVETTPATDVLDKAVQVGEDDLSTDDRTSAYPGTDSTAEALDVLCPPPPMPVPLDIDWASFLRSTTEPWPRSDINWMTDEDDEDAPSIQPKPSPVDEFLPDDQDLPSISTVADIPAIPLQVEETDLPTSFTVADVPAEPMMPSKESAAKIMNLDDVDDPFSDEGPRPQPMTSEFQGPSMSSLDRSTAP